MGDLTANFDREEFACKCGCGADHIELQLVEKIQMIRNALGVPLQIRSGVRCAKRNAAVGGKENSAHLRGLAVDVFVPTSNFRYLFLRQAIKIFRRIEVPSGQWVHVDQDESLPQDVCFTS